MIEVALSSDTLIQEIETILARESCDPSQFPGYQTYDVSGERAFQSIVQSFVQACSEVGCHGSRVQMWAYKDNKTRQCEFGHDLQWHDHYRPGNLLSGVMYLRNDDNVGTEFQSGFVTPSDCFTWNLFDPSMIHRPGKLLSNAWRYSFAANLFR